MECVRIQSGGATWMATITDFDQSTMVVRLKNDDELILKEILSTLGPRIEGLLKKHFPYLRHEDCKDILQDAIFRLWRARATYDPAKGSLQKWFYKIAENQLKDSWKRNKFPLHVCDPSELADSEKSPRTPSEGEEDAPQKISPKLRAFLEIFARLPEEHRRILLAHIQKGGKAGQWAVDLEREFRNEGKKYTAGNLRVLRNRIYKSIRLEMERCGFRMEEPAPDPGMMGSV
jgi:RNA polymerase sigma factor (sigma-70 family)